MLELGYFPDVTFTNLPPLPEPGSARVSKNKDEPNTETGYGFGEAYDRFVQAFHSIRQDTGADLPLVGRNIYCLPENIFFGIVDGEGQAKRYGDYIKKDIVGYTLRFPDNTFDIYILGLSGGRVASVDDAVVTLGHEYGHTIGPFLGPVEEELKAYAFQSMFLKHALGDKPNKIDSGLYPTRVHDVAKNRLAQLRSRGFPEGSVVAHLTGENFGEFKPDSNLYLPL